LKDRIWKNILGIIHIPFKSGEAEALSTGETRRIRMVNYIGLISTATVLSYIVLYSILDYHLFLPAILFLTASGFAFILVMVLNRLGHYKKSKFLIALFNSLSMATIAFWIFGNEPGFQVYLLVAAIIPLFLWPISQKTYLISFAIFNYGLYFFIEFINPFSFRLIHLPQNLIDAFYSTNVIVCFVTAAVAIIFYTILASKNEESLLKKTTELEESQQHQNLVYSVIAHDLRNPFNGLVGLTTLLKHYANDYDEGKKQEMIDAIFDSSTSLNGLLNNLLEWSKIKSGLHNINKRVIDLHPLVEESSDLLKEMALDKNIKILNKITPKTMVFADSFMISTVIRNILTNAIKFTSKGGTIQISATKTGDTTQVSIMDSGIGIPAKYLKDLFNIKSTFTKLGTGAERGSGLGLKLCSDFIEVNSGKIWAESEVDKGSKFYFSLQSTDNQLD
jgi:two-component system, sensor histidine kinase and response regulator